MSAPTSSSRGSSASDWSPNTRSKSGVVAYRTAPKSRSRPDSDEQAALDEPRDGRVGADAADPGDLGPRARAEVGDDRERLERAPERPRSTGRSKRRAQASAACARGAEREATGDVLEHDPAAALAVALGEQLERVGDPLRVVLRRVGELLLGERQRGDDEQSLDRAGELLDRIRGD